MNSAADVQSIVRSLNAALEQANDLEHALVVHLGFSEIRFILEALENEGGIAQQAIWFSSDSAFDDSSIPNSLRERDDTAPLPFPGLQYLRFHVENSIDVRGELLRRVFQETGSVSFDVTFVHDAAMLMYLTLEKMGNLVEEHALFPPTLKTVSEVSYGSSGYLGLSDAGFRQENEYLIGVSTPREDSALDSVWTAFQFLKSVGSGSFASRNFFLDFVKYLDEGSLQSLSLPCDDYTIVGQTFDYLGRPIEYEFTSEEVQNNDLSVPLFFSSSFHVLCSDSRLEVTCPPNGRETILACSGQLSQGSNEKIDAKGAFMVVLNYTCFFCP